MWLPETAVDNESLEILTEAGMKFTILAPHQAWRIRKIGTEVWEEVNDRIDPSRPYLWRGPRGQTLALFFYDGPISRAIAFENALDRGENLVARLKAGFVADRDGAQLVHCATDGESYGHHKQFGDMALAAAIAQLEAEGFATLTNYSSFLVKHRPLSKSRSGSGRRGAARTASSGGGATAGAGHARTGTSAGGNHCGKRSTGSETRSTRSTSHVPRPSSRTPGRRETPTSR